MFVRFAKGFVAALMVVVGLFGVLGGRMNMEGEITGVAARSVGGLFVVCGVIFLGAVLWGKK